ncbi:MAG: hypothetical protein ACOX7F_09860, partial [Eubacteriales bacterium]
DTFKGEDCSYCRLIQFGGGPKLHTIGINKTKQYRQKFALHPYTLICTHWYQFAPTTFDLHPLAEILSIYHFFSKKESGFFPLSFSFYPPKYRQLIDAKHVFSWVMENTFFIFPLPLPAKLLQH